MDRGHNPLGLILCLDWLARQSGARLHRAQEEVGHVIAEPDHRRVDLSARTLRSRRGISEPGRTRGRGAVDIRGAYAPARDAPRAAARRP